MFGTYHVNASTIYTASLESYFKNSRLKFNEIILSQNGHMLINDVQLSHHVVH
jgi:hypothetical protein